MNRGGKGILGPIGKLFLGQGPSTGIIGPIIGLGGKFY